MSLQDKREYVLKVNCFGLLNVPSVTLRSINRDLKMRRRQRERQKRIKISKTTTLHVDHAFLYISLPSQHDYDVKIPNFTFYGGRKQATTKFSFSF